MGKPYASELGALPATYGWCMTAETGSLSAAIASLAPDPLLAIGSGGSLTAAHFACALHETHTGQIAKALTPLDLVSSDIDLTKMSVLFLSAGGRNPDVLGAFRRIIMREPRHVTILTFDSQSPLARLARQYRHVDFVSFDLPSRKDGFLATNTLLGNVVLLSRSYAQMSSLTNSLPDSLEELLEPSSMELWLAALRERCEHLWSRETLVVLYGPTGRSAAVDIESKFTEAALGTVQLADYRNFAHGRHYWLARRGDATGILAFVSDEDRGIASKMLRLIPSGIPIVRIELRGDNVRAGVAAILSALHVAGLAGAAQGVDPGSPSVPSFGRDIYHLQGLGRTIGAARSAVPRETVAIARKAGEDVSRLLTRHAETAFWRSAYRSFVEALEATSFQALVLDYDGTLCDASERHSGLGKAAGHALIALLSLGVPIGIATGRGDSVRKELRDSLPRDLWSRVLVGYHNGADIGLLDDDSHPDSATEPCEALRPIAEALQSDEHLQSLATCHPRRAQISVRPRLCSSVGYIWNVVQHHVQVSSPSGITLVQSAHSVDVLAPGVSKRKVVEQVRETFCLHAVAPVLCIADRGGWPGNDFTLLSEPCSLSVDRVSPDPKTCWNLAPVGYRGAQATLAYLRSLQVVDGTGRISVARMNGITA